MWGTKTPVREPLSIPKPARKNVIAGQIPYCADFLRLDNDEMLSAARASFSDRLCAYVRIVNAVSACASHAEMIATGTLCSRCMSVAQVCRASCSRIRLTPASAPAAAQRSDTVSGW